MLAGRSHGWGWVNHVAAFPGAVGRLSARLGSPPHLLPCHSLQGRGGEGERCGELSEFPVVG